MQQLNLIGEAEGTPLFSQPVQTQTRIPFADCRVDAPNVRAFITQYYRTERLQGIERDIPGYTETVIASHERDYAAHGYCIISRHESNTGQPVAWPTLQGA